MSLYTLEKLVYLSRVNQRARSITSISTRGAAWYAEIDLIVRCRSVLQKAMLRNELRQELMTNWNRMFANKLLNATNCREQSNTRSYEAWHNITNTFFLHLYTALPIIHQVPRC